jgi:glycosyltransferase involved in cell wall biosynthesis
MWGPKIYFRLAGVAQEARMIRVLLVTGSVPPAPCGVGDYTFKLAQSLAGLGKIETAILTGNPVSASEKANAVPVFTLVASWKLRGAGQVVRFLNQWEPDIVHVQYPTQGYGRGLLPSLIPLLARMRGVRSVQTWHEGFSRRDAFKLLIQLSAGSQPVVVRSNFIELVHPILRWPVKLSGPSLIPNASAIPRARCTEEELRLIKRSLLQGQQRLIVFFGFLYPPKGTELLFEVADPETDHIVIAGPADEGSPYLGKLKQLAGGPSWKGRVTFTGFVSPERASLILAAADAVILPFRQGSGPWNTSIHSATLNEAFVITTSSNPSGYDRTANVYYAHPDDVTDMRSALALHCGRRINFCKRETTDRDDWDVIARKHHQIYAHLLGGDP